MRLGALFLSLVLVALAAGAQERVVAGLSEDRVSITTNFDGSEILVFGAVRRDGPPPAEPDLDVIVTVEGPRMAVDVHHKNRVAGIWINTETGTVEVAPSFYAVSGTGPLEDILSEEQDQLHRISVARRLGPVYVAPGIPEPARFSEALLRLRTDAGAYHTTDEPVELAEETLFTTSFLLPANLIEGDYLVRIFLLRGGAVIDEHATRLGVRKVGVEHFLYTLAYLNPVVYGVLALVIAVVAGWGASVFFRLMRS